MEYNALDQISQRVEIIFEGWHNGKKGAICDEKGNGIFRFIETYRGENGMWNYRHLELEDNPIVCVGIAGQWLIRRRSGSNLLNKLTQLGAHLDSKENVREMYKDYTEMRFRQYKYNLKDDPHMWDWEDDDWKRAFYCDYIIPHETKLNRISKSLLEFLSEDDGKLVRLVMDNYIEYLEKCKEEWMPAPAIATQKKKTSPSEKKVKPLEVATGQHKTFPVIAKGDDPYRKAQVFDLYVAMSKKKKENGLELISADMRDFINCFTEGTTSSTIIWNGTKRQLHFIVYEWKHREHISFGKEDNVWDVASKIFTNPKKKKNGMPTFFDAEDLRKTRSPENIPQELEDIIEILNPNNPSPNYHKFAKNSEDRIKFGQRVRDNKGANKSEKTAWDIHMDKAFEDNDDD